MRSCAVLKKVEGRTLAAGGAFVFDNEIDIIKGDIENGDVINIEAFNGYPLGTGVINTNSKISLIPSKSFPYISFLHYQLLKDNKCNYLAPLEYHFTTTGIVISQNTFTSLLNHTMISVCIFHFHKKSGP